MRTAPDSASRAIRDYFSSPNWRTPPESDLLAVILRELMEAGEPATNKAIIARVIDKLKVEGDEMQLQRYGALLTQIIGTQPEE
ncbi:biofilm development regulator YmgB/AriR family protein [Pantoea sp. Ep11b]|uniref:biofilm development regulator YmgB/AriR family protein n=1 Tax=Pantoea sp. Ep11b TaxID=3141459 RepID=UPI003461050A